MGDFNKVLRWEEHMGVAERSYAKILAFRETVDVCGITGIGYARVHHGL
jgi:hypothetical protein